MDRVLTKEKTLLELERSYSDISHNIDDALGNDGEIDCVEEDNVAEDIFCPFWPLMNVPLNQKAKRRQ